MRAPKMDCNRRTTLSPDPSMASTHGPVTLPPMSNPSTIDNIATRARTRNLEFPQDPSRLAQPQASTSTLFEMCDLVRTSPRIDSDIYISQLCRTGFERTLTR